MRTLAIVGGFILLVLGSISMLTPIPGASLLLAAGAAILICLSPRARQIVRRRRERWHWLHRYMLWLERKVPGRLSDALILTRPDATEAE